MSTLKILQGDWVDQLKQVPDKTVQTVPTSPPYWGLRDYGHEGQLGQEDDPNEYVEKLVLGFREVRRVMKDDGTLWLNLGDSYASPWPCSRISKMGAGSLPDGRRAVRPPRMAPGTKEKDLVGIPWMVAYALRADGWYLRSRIPWIKRNCMPESVKDRPTTAVEDVFLLTKSQDYFYDKDAVAVPAIYGTSLEGRGASYTSPGTKEHKGPANGRKSKIRGEFAGKTNELEGREAFRAVRETRNRRNSDWFFESWQGLFSDEEGEPLAFVTSLAPYKGAHFATWPPKLVRPMILAGSRPGDMVLDPFGGSGTTAAAALEAGRSAIVCELNPEYCELIRRRCAVNLGLGL